MDANYDKAKIVPRSEIVNSTARLSAFEDFMKRTVTTLQGVWARLNYIRELRQADGTYEHWGLARIHGSIAAEETSERYIPSLRFSFSKRQYRN
jgi:hypothetical protein